MSFIPDIWQSKAEFQKPFLHSVTSTFRNHSDMLSCSSGNTFLLSMLKAVVLLHIFVETVIHLLHLFWDIDSWLYI